MNESTPSSKDLKAMVNRRTALKRSFVAAILFVGILSVFAFLPSSPRTPAIAIDSPEVPDPFKDVTLTAQAAVVYDLKEKRILFDNNAEAQLPLASLAKLLTAEVAYRALGEDAEITIDLRALEAEGDSGLQAGERFSVRDLIALALVGSSNDAAEALTNAAVKRRGSDGAALLGSAATALGLSQTYAVNGTGLDSSETISGAYGSAHDVALMAGAVAYDLPEIARLTTDGAVEVTALSGVRHKLPNTDPYVAMLPGLLLSKTGYTDLAGGNLALVFDAGIAHPIAVVVLGSTREGRFTDARALIEAALVSFTLATYAR